MNLKKMLALLMALAMLLTALPMAFAENGLEIEYEQPPVEDLGDSAPAEESTPVQAAAPAQEPAPVAEALVIDENVAEPTRAGDHTVTFKSGYGDNVTLSTATVGDGNTVTQPNDPTRVGYAFKEWQNEQGGTYYFANPVTSNLTLTAAWTPVEVTVTYAVTEQAGIEAVVGAGNATNAAIVDGKGTKKVAFGEAIYVPVKDTDYKVPTGYDLDAWKCDNVAIADFDWATWAAGKTNEVIAAGPTFTASWTIQTFSIEYDSGAEATLTIPADTVLDYGAQVTLTAPTDTAGGTYAQNHVFNGWKDGKGTIHKANDELYASEDLQLVGTWDEKTWTVAYYTEDGATRVGEETVVNGSLAQLNVQAPASTDAGKEFDKWVKLDGSAFDPETPIKADVNLKATYKLKTYTVEFKSDGVLKGTAYVLHGEKVAPGDVPTVTKTGYQQSATKPWLVDGSQQTAFDFDAEITKNWVVNANWEAASVTVTYTNGGVEGATLPTENPLNKKYGDTLTLAAALPAVKDQDTTNQRFVNWTIKFDTDLENVDPDGKDIIDKPVSGTLKLDEDNAQVTTTNAAGLKIAATWQEFITVNFYKEEADIAGAAANPPTATALKTQDFDVAAGTTNPVFYTSAPEDPTQDGKRFDGWALSTDPAKKVITNLPQYPIRKNTNFVGVWTEVCTVKFDLAGGSGEAPDVVIEKGKSFTQSGKTLPEPTKVGYELAGWKANNADFTAAIPVSTNLTVTAVWTPKVWDVTFVPGDGATFTGNTTAKVSNNDTVSKPVDDPKLDGKVFQSWNVQDATTGAVAETAYDFTTPVTANLTLVATWADAVAKIGTTPYATLEDAIEAAKANDTITLLADVTQKADLAIGTALTLDLNGKKLDLGGKALNAGAKVTIKGAGSTSEIANGAINATGTGEVAITAGTFRKDTFSADTGAKVTITGGYFDTDKIDESYLPTGQMLYSANGQLYSLTAYHTLTYKFGNGEDDLVVKVPAAVETTEYDADPKTAGTQYPEREGYRFVDWSTAAAHTAGDAFVFRKTLNADVVLNAHWQQAWTVKFSVYGETLTDANGEEITLLVDNNTAIAAADTVVIEAAAVTAAGTDWDGFPERFQYWMNGESEFVLAKPADGGNPAVAGTKVTSDLTLEARWMNKVVFDTDNGTFTNNADPSPYTIVGSKAVQYVADGGLATQPTNNPTKANYAFKNWDFNFAEEIYENRTIWAMWTHNAGQWDVGDVYNWYAEPGAYSSGTKTLTYVGTDAKPLVLAWHEAEDGREAGYYLGFEIEAPAEVKKNGAQLYAYRLGTSGAWKPVNGESGEFTNVDAKGTLSMDTFIPVTIDELKALAAATTKTKTYTYQFAIYNATTNTYGEPIADQDIKVVVDPKYVEFYHDDGNDETDDTEFVIGTVGKPYVTKFTVTFVKGTVNEANDIPPAVTVDSCGTLTWPAKDPTAEGAAFAGWKIADPYADGGMRWFGFKNDEWEGEIITGDTTLTAAWYGEWEAWTQGNNAGTAKLQPMKDGAGRVLEGQFELPCNAEYTFVEMNDDGIERPRDGWWIGITFKAPADAFTKSGNKWTTTATINGDPISAEIWSETNGYGYLGGSNPENGVWWYTNWWFIDADRIREANDWNGGYIPIDLELKNSEEHWGQRMTVQLNVKNITLKDKKGNVVTKFVNGKEVYQITFHYGKNNALKQTLELTEGEFFQVNPTEAQPKVPKPAADKDYTWYTEDKQEIDPYGPINSSMDLYAGDEAIEVTFKWFEDDEFPDVRGVEKGATKADIIAIGEELLGDTEGFQGWIDEDGKAFEASDTTWTLTEPLTLTATWEPEDVVTINPTLNLESEIGINFYFVLPEGATASEYSVNVKYANSYQTIDKDYAFTALKYDEKHNDYKLVALQAGSDEMSDEVTITVTHGDAVVGEGKYSIKSIATGWLDNGENVEAHQMLKNMLQYGHYAEIEFEHNANKTAIPAGATALSAIPSSFAIGEDPTTLADYVENFECTLALDAAVGMNIYIKPMEGYGLADFTVSVKDNAGKAVAIAAPTMKKGEIVAKVTGIYPDKLLKDYEITVTVAGESATYKRSVISCARLIEQKNLVVNLVQSLYQYSAAADAYFA